METSADSVPLTRLNLNMHTLFAFRVSSLPTYRFRLMEFQVLLKTAFTTKKTLSFTINYRSQPWTVVHPQLQVKSVSMTKTILFWTLQVQNPTLVSLPTYTTVSKTTRPWIKAHPVGKKKFSRMPYTKILMIFSHFPAEVIIARTKIQNKN